MAITKKNALLSVYNKEGIVKFAQKLIDFGCKLYASGGTARTLSEAGLEVTDIATIVGPPILGHRVVTLSREIHAGLLAANSAEDLAELERLGIPWFELVYVDLYPLEKEIASPTATLESVIEKTDIGGPAMLRAAAKGRRLVISDEMSRKLVLMNVEDDFDPDSFEPVNSDDATLRNLLAARAEMRIAKYCLASAGYSEGAFFNTMFSEVEREMGPVELAAFPNA